MAGVGGGPVERVGGRRLERVEAGPFTLPNALSALRLFLIPPFLAFYLAGDLVIAAILFAVAATTDVFDGLLARLLRQRSTLGAVLDPVADKSLGLAALTAVVVHGILPVWLLALSLARDAVVLVIALWTRARGERLDAHPSRMGKYATSFLNAAVILALIWEISYAPWLSGYLKATALIAGECLAVAAVQYAWRFSVAKLRR